MAEPKNTRKPRTRLPAKKPPREGWDQKTGRYMGRPPKISVDLIDKILNALRAGAYMECAAAAAGVNRQTLYDWLRKGERCAQAGTWEKKYDAHVYFSNNYQKAIAEAEMRDLGIIAKASEVQWQAAAWKLERKYPEKWGRQDRHDVRFSGVLGTMSLTAEEELEYKRAVAEFFQTGEAIDVANTNQIED